MEVNRQICREHYLLRLRIQGQFPVTSPGQFVQLGCGPPDGASARAGFVDRSYEWDPGQQVRLHHPELSGALALLRRPFSLAGRGDDDRGAWIEIIHRVVGVGTAWLSGLETGDAVDLIGPLGNSFDLPSDKSLALLVGGGVGLPPMFYLAQSLSRAGWDAVGFIGAQSADLLAVTRSADQAVDPQGAPTQSVVEFSRYGYPTVVTTDDGSVGLRGLITQGLLNYVQSLSVVDIQRTVVCTCGPNPMMRAVADLALDRGLSCQVCMEQEMACGMGTCQSCVVRIEEHDAPHARTDQGRPWRYRLDCTDGPVFEADSIVW